MGLEASANARSCDVQGTEEEVAHHVLVLSICLPQGAAGTRTYSSFSGTLGTPHPTCTNLLLLDLSSNSHCLAHLSKEQPCKIK